MGGSGDDEGQIERSGVFLHAGMNTCEEITGWEGGGRKWSMVVGFGRALFDGNGRRQPLEDVGHVGGSGQPSFRPHTHKYIAQCKLYLLDQLL